MNEPRYDEPIKYQPPRESTIAEAVYRWSMLLLMLILTYNSLWYLSAIYEALRARQ